MLFFELLLYVCLALAPCVVISCCGRAASGARCHRLPHLLSSQARASAAHLRRCPHRLEPRPPTCGGAPTGSSMAAVLPPPPPPPPPPPGGDGGRPPFGGRAPPSPPSESEEDIDLRVCWKCGRKAYLRKGGCANIKCVWGLVEAKENECRVHLQAGVASQLPVQEESEPLVHGRSEGLYYMARAWQPHAKGKERRAQWSPKAWEAGHMVL